MSVKESSHELNPPAVSAKEVVVSPHHARSARITSPRPLRLAVLVISPLAPGTRGSLLAVGGYWLAQLSLLGHPIDTSEHYQSVKVFSSGSLLVAIGVITLLGIWAASRTERDPQYERSRKGCNRRGRRTICPLCLCRCRELVMHPIMVLNNVFLVFRFFIIVKAHILPGNLSPFTVVLGMTGRRSGGRRYAAIVVACNRVWFWLATSLGGMNGENRKEKKDKSEKRLEERSLATSDVETLSDIEEIEWD